MNKQIIEKRNFCGGTKYLPLLVVVIVALAYVNSFNGPFIFDDRHSFQASQPYNSPFGGSSKLLRMREPAALVVLGLKMNTDRWLIEEPGSKIKLLTIMDGTDKILIEDEVGVMDVCEKIWLRL